MPTTACTFVENFAQVLVQAEVRDCTSLARRAPIGSDKEDGSGKKFVIRYV